MKKYYIGLIIIMLATFGLTGFLLVQAASTKQDTETSRKAQDIAEKLNSYVSSNGVPESLAAANIKDVPSTVTYYKTGDDKYEFCVTYKHASEGLSEGVLSQIITGGFQRNLQTDYPVTDPNYPQSYLYLSTSHKAGKDCQTVQAYSYNYNSPEFKSGLNLNSSYDFGTTSLSANASDTERQTDIKALYAQLEAYYAQKGLYPTLANLNDSAWRKTNLKGLDDEALRDPKGTGYTLVAVPTKNSYSYNVSSDTGKPCDNAGGNECTVYMLQATLENGTTFTKNSLN